MAGGKASAGILEYAGANTPGWVSNLGISYSAGVLTIVDAQGASLSPSNPGWVTVPGTTAGQLRSLQVTAPASFNDDAHASSDLNNLGFGITESVDWAQDVPFFLYVANRGNADLDGADGSSVFFISRSPCMATTPSSANNIGDTGAIPTNDNEEIILILDDVTIANYTSLNCQLIGGFRMRWSTATDDWTVQSLGSLDGVGISQVKKLLSKLWIFPAGQNGAASASTYLKANGGTAPVFNTNNYQYMVHDDGRVTVYVALNGDGGTDGAGNVATQVSLPCKAQDSLGVTSVGYGILKTNSSVVGAQFCAATIETGGPQHFLLREGGGNNMENADFGNGDREIYGVFSYKSFTETP